jgi:hypothetical protein
MLLQERYDRAITAFVPEYALAESEETRLNRCRLMFMRDVAADTLSHPDQHVADAVTLSRVMSTVAASYCYGSAEDLGTAVLICRRLMMCGKALDRLGEAVNDATQ